MSSLDDLSPSFPIECTREYALALSKSVFGSRLPERYGARLSNSVGRMTWTLVWENLTASEVATLRTAFDDAKLGNNTTTFTPPGEASITVEILDNEFNVEWNGPAFARKVQMSVRSCV